MEFNHDKGTGKAIFKNGAYAPRVILYSEKATATTRPSAIIARALRALAYAALTDAAGIECQFEKPTTCDDIEKQVALMKYENAII